jgi:hypothetical protein
VTYRVTFGGGAAVQYHDLPELAQDALLACAVRLAEAPWDNTVVLPPGDDAAFRETVFGAGRGLVAFYVNDHQEVVLIFNIVWIA